MLHALLLLAALPWGTCSSAHGNQRRVIQQPGLIRFPITVSEAPAGTYRRLRRQNNADLTSQSTGFFYTIDLVIGTPGQAVPVNFDTGSWELWVNPSCANTSETAICESLPRFTGSTTLVDTNRTGQIAYGAGYAKFKYMYDYISVGGKDNHHAVHITSPPVARASRAKSRHQQGQRSTSKSLAWHTTPRSLPMAS